MDPSEALIVALDLPSAGEAFAYLDRVGPGARWVKVGHELFYAEGPAVVRRLKERGLKVFMDAKLHDIPTTVQRALTSVREAGADMVNVHALGGRAMLAAAAAALRGSGSRLLAVTVLTSQDEASLREIGVAGPPGEAVLRLAALAREAGAQGVVASGQEVRGLREALGRDFWIVVPGVRSRADAADDQKRSTTVRQALERGADQVVLGRTLSRAPDPARRFSELQDEAGAGIRAAAG